jgi:hypothetical protein
MRNYPRPFIANSLEVVCLHFAQIVDDASSSLDSTAERKDSIDANHVMMCRFLSKDDEGYIKTIGVISKYVHEIKMNIGKEHKSKLTSVVPHSPVRIYI